METGHAGAGGVQPAPWKAASPEQIRSQVGWRAGTFSPALPSAPAALPCQGLWPGHFSQFPI